MNLSSGFLFKILIFSLFCLLASIAFIVANERFGVFLTVEVAGPTPENTPQDVTAPLPQFLNLDVPFIVQAPFGDWSYPFNHNCEEASILMVRYYFEGKSVVDPSQTKKELLDMVAFETEKYGFHENTSAAETAQFARDYYGYDALVHDFSADNIKKELSRGNPIIVPVAGRLLNNAYYKPPGPVDHMLLIKGYTDTEFITNDPGTEKGADLHFSYQTLEDAARDYGGNIATGKKLMIVIHPK